MVINLAFYRKLLMLGLVCYDVYLEGSSLFGFSLEVGAVMSCLGIVAPPVARCPYIFHSVKVNIIKKHLIMQ